MDSTRNASAGQIGCGAMLFIGFLTWTIFLCRDGFSGWAIPNGQADAAKKNGMTKRKVQYWVIPPEADAEFVANMEEVLETYAQPYDPACPVICMDEQPVQLVKETRKIIPATKTHARRVDYEYERAGTASIFMFAEPLAGWRQATAREHRTKSDWAIEVAAHLDGRFADCERIRLVSDNLNTHTKGAFYEVFPPEKARDLLWFWCWSLNSHEFSYFLERLTHKGFLIGGDFVQ
jgi:hypothetical protein